MTIVFGLLIALVTIPFKLIGLILGKLPGPLRIIAIIVLLTGAAVLGYFAYDLLFPGTTTVPDTPP